MAYSPIRSSPTSDTTTSSNNSNKNSEYSKKLLDLKNAMDLLKTPPAPVPQAQPQQASHLVSYTPIKSSSLAKLNSISPFAYSFDSIEISMEDSSSPDTETTPLAHTTANTSNTDNPNDSYLLDSYNEEDSFLNPRSNNDPAIFSSPTLSRSYSNLNNLSNPPSSPYISSEELKNRLEATREAFQRSLEAQKRRLRTSISFQDIDSSFSTCGSGFDSDLSVDSLRDTKNQLERIKKEVAELIESDLEDVESIRNKKRLSNDNLMTIPDESWTATFFKFLSVFTISSIIFTFLFINHVPDLSTIVNYFASFDKQNILEKLEDTLNFLLQD